MKKQFNVRLDEFDIDKINEFCNEMNISQSDLVHSAFWILMDAIYEGDSYENSIRALRRAAVLSLHIDDKLI